PLLSLVLAVVMRADLTHIGDQSGCLLITSAASPAMCGVDIDVPDSVSNRLPPCPAGETAAMTSLPGPMMSGFSRSPPLDRAGPRLEKSATVGASTFTWVPTDSAAVGLAVPAMYALMACPEAVSTCTVGTTWKSALSEFGEGFHSTMPTPPASL